MLPLIYRRDGSFYTAGSFAPRRGIYLGLRLNRSIRASRRRGLYYLPAGSNGGFVLLRVALDEETHAAKPGKLHVHESAKGGRPSWAHEFL